MAEQEVQIMLHFETKEDDNWWNKEVAASFQANCN